MAKKYGFIYIAKSVLKGVAAFGLGELCGYATETVCRKAGLGKVAAFPIKVAGFCTGAMIAKKTGDYIDETAGKIEAAVVKHAKSIEGDS